MSPASTPPNDDKKTDLPEEVGARETANEHLDDGQSVTESDSTGVNSGSELATEEVATSGAGGFETSEVAGGTGLDVPADDNAPAEVAVTCTSADISVSGSPGANVSPPDLSVSEPLLAAVDDRELASMSTLPPDLPMSIPLAPLEAQRNDSAPPIEPAFLATNRSPETTSSQSPSAAVTTASATSPSMTRPTVLISLVEAQVRRIVQELMDNQIDRDARVLEEMVTSKIAAEFTHRACEEKAAYGDW